MAPKVDRTYILVDVSPRMHTRLPLVEQALFGLAMSKVCQVSDPGENGFNARQLVHKALLEVNPFH